MKLIIAVATVSLFLILYNSFKKYLMLIGVVLTVQALPYSFKPGTTA